MANQKPIDEEARPPSLFWTLAEGRAIYELGGFILSRPFLNRLPKGDGHPVIVLPGFLASDRSTAPLRGLLGDLGYAAHAWGMGRNLVFNDEREEELMALIERIHGRHSEKASLIGWSLGGVFAREIAKRHPDKVRSVITLGSPIRSPRDFSNARHIYDRVNGSPEETQAERISQLNVPPPVPTTSIYSKTDGVVSWRGSVQDPHPANPQTENIEIPASHFGIGVNPFAMLAIADRLSQEEGAWRPFNREGFKGVFFKSG
ncbi:MAG: alpha/beta hydrolase [Pseudomonadota bacterium]